MTEYFKIGKIIGAFGLDGQVTLKHTLGKKTSLKGLECFFTEQKNGTFLPWFITATKIKNETEVYIQVEGIAMREKALPLMQKEVWLRQDDFKKFASKSTPQSMLGYTVFNNDDPLGLIHEIIEQPHQLLCKVLVQEKEALIPLNEQFLQEINHRKKTVTVSLPHGLLEIYLG